MVITECHEQVVSIVPCFEQVLSLYLATESGSPNLKHFVSFCRQMEYEQDSISNISIVLYVLLNKDENTESCVIAVCCVVKYTTNT